MGYKDSPGHHGIRRWRISTHSVKEEEVSSKIVLAKLSSRTKVLAYGLFIFYPYVKQSKQFLMQYLHGQCISFCGSFRVCSEANEARFQRHPHWRVRYCSRFKLAIVQRCDCHNTFATTKGTCPTDPGSRDPTSHGRFGKTSS